MKRNVVQEKALNFGAETVMYCEGLRSTRHYNLANQLERSATSVGANVWEAQGAQSRKDFIHKMKIAYKEALETNYWLQLCDRLPFTSDCKDLLLLQSELCRLLGAIISTANRNLNKG